MFNTVSSEWFPSEIQEYIGDFSVGSEVYWKGEYNKTLKLLEKRSDDSINYTVILVVNMVLVFLKN